MTENFQSQQLVAEQSVPPADITLPLTVQDQVAFGGVAIGTITGMILLVREVRLLVKACKG